VPTHANLCLSSECIPTKADRLQSAVPTHADLCLSSEGCAYSCQSVSIFGVHPNEGTQTGRQASECCAHLCLSSECIPTMPICVCLQSAMPTQRVSTCVYLQSAVPTQCQSVSIFRVRCPLNADLCPSLCLSSQCCAHLCVYLQSAVPKCLSRRMLLK